MIKATLQAIEALAVIEMYQHEVYRLMAAESLATN
jgi:hypothetical protein